eukprot:131344-Pelagomonas_calceolata.AAC.1
MGRDISEGIRGAMTGDGVDAIHSIQLVYDIPVGIKGIQLMLLEAFSRHEEHCHKLKMLSASKIPVQDFLGNLAVQTAEGLEGSGCPQSPRSKKKRKTT